MRSLETPTTTLKLLDDGVLVARSINPEIPRTVETTHEVMDAIAELVGEDRRPILWDIRESSVGSPESMAAFVGRVVDQVTALGLLLDDEAGRALRSKIEAFAPAVGALLLPVRLFREEAAALEWLQEYVGPD